MTSNGGGDREALREDIRRTRAELGRTVEALAAKADVKARLKDSTDQARERLREQANQTGQRVRAQVNQVTARIRGQEVTGSARQAAQTVGRSPVPWFVIAVGALTAAVVLLIRQGGRR